MRDATTLKEKVARAQASEVQLKSGQAAGAAAAQAVLVGSPRQEATQRAAQTSSRLRGPQTPGHGTRSYQKSGHRTHGYDRRSGLYCILYSSVLILVTVVRFDSVQ